MRHDGFDAADPQSHCSSLEVEQFQSAVGNWSLQLSLQCQLPLL
jgi:hypothetical protein